jgi:hypothetical protein
MEKSRSDLAIEVLGTDAKVNPEFRAAIKESAEKKIRELQK